MTLWNKNTILLKTKQKKLQLAVYISIVFPNPRTPLFPYSLCTSKTNKQTNKQKVTLLIPLLERQYNVAHIQEKIV